MIDDVKDLTRKNAVKEARRRKFLKTYGMCTPGTLIFIFGTTLFAIFMTGDFLGSFTPENAFETVGRFLTTGFIFLALFLAVYSYTENGQNAARNFTLVTIVVSLTYVTCLTTAYYFNVYTMPIAVITLILIELLDRKTAIISTAAAAILILMSYVFTDQLPFGNFNLDGVISSVICNSVAAIAISFFVDKHYNRLKFLLTAFASAAVVVPLIIASTLASGDLSIQLLWNVLWGYGSSVSSIIVFMPFVAIFEGIFNIADDFRLNEMTKLSQPLLKRLASEAPGTYNHSLVVGTIAEACAEAIGENPLFARCAAYYHDIGKLKAPVYFSENQSTYNPHDELIPEVSVSMITSHTLFGEILAKQYRLPPEIVAICREHHGTTPVGYFYRKALNLTEAGDLPSENYTYSGPKPQSKVSAIVMISDTVEAASRANMPATKEEFVAMINKLINDKLNLGQFDECPLTMKDISTIKEVIIEVVPSVHHSRVSYEKRKL